MHQILNERLKLLASFFNSLATAVFSIGTLGPIAALLYGGDKVGLPGEYVASYAILWMIAGGFLHISGQIILGSMKP